MNRGLVSWLASKAEKQGETPTGSLRLKPNAALCVGVTGRLTLCPSCRGRTGRTSTSGGQAEVQSKDHNAITMNTIKMNGNLRSELDQGRAHSTASVGPGWVGLGRALRSWGMFLALTSLGWAGDPSGRWTWEIKGPQGQTLKSELQLSWKDAVLSGTVNNRAGKTAIQEATFKDDRVIFKVVRDVRGRTIVTQYDGRLEGDRLTGTVKTVLREDRPFTVTWDARRVEP